MYFTLQIGSSPWGESCVQTLDPHYGLKAYRECRAFKKQLLRHYAAKLGHEPPEGVTLVIVENPYECPYGAYVTVDAKFDEDDGAAGEAAYWFEGNIPEQWDEEARAELGPTWGLPEFP